MEGLVIVALWLAVNIWATSFVYRRAATGAEKAFSLLAIWLLPFIGAALAILILGAQTKFKKTDSTDKMFQTIVDSHKDGRPD